MSLLFSSKMAAVIHIKITIASVIQLFRETFTDPSSRYKHNDIHMVTIADIRNESHCIHYLSIILKLH